jgi:hypothetical protein
MIEEADKLSTSVIIPEEYVCSVILYKGNKSTSTLLRPEQNTNSEAHIQPYQTLLGSTTTTGQLLKNINGKEGLYFFFADLSVRIAGFYTLSVHALHIPTYQSLISGTVACAPLHTEPFQVYPSKQFPGMLGIND